MVLDNYLCALSSGSYPGVAAFHCLKYEKSAFLRRTGAVLKLEARTTTQLLWELGWRTIEVYRCSNYNNVDRVEGALHETFKLHYINGRRVLLSTMVGAGSCGGTIDKTYSAFITYNVHGPDGTTLTECRDES